MFSIRIRLIILICFLLVIPSLLIGCSEKQDIGTVSGRVTLQGQPLTTGRIQFSNQEKTIMTNANINGDGTYVVKTYKADGLPPDEYRIAIFGTPISTEAIAVDTVQKTPSVFIPPKYQNIATSELTATVKSGQNEPFNFDLE